MLARHWYMAAASVLAVAFFGAAQAAETIVVSSHSPGTHFLTAELLVQWGKDVEKASNGSLKVNVLKAPLGTPAAQFEVARDGVADVTFGVPGYTPGRFVLAEVAGVPNIGNTAESLSVGLWRTVLKFPQMEAEFEGVKLLGLAAVSPRQFWNGKRAINSLDDFKGLKIRVSGGLDGKVAKAIGVTTILQPAGKVYELLSNGVIDGVVFPKETMKSMKLERFIKFGTLVPGGLSGAPMFLVMNQKRFDGLSKADQGAIMSASGEHFSKLNGPLWDTRDQAGVDHLLAHGAKIATASPALVKQIKAVTQGVVDGWIAEAKSKRGVDGAALLRVFREEVEKYEATM